MKSIILLAAFLGLVLGTSQKISNPEKLLSAPSSDVLVSLGAIPASIYARVKSSSVSRSSRISGLVASLKAHAADAGQGEIVRLLENASPPPASFNPLWITNQIAVYGATPELISQLASLPQVSAITEDVHLTLEPIGSPSAAPAPRRDDSSPPEWGVAKISAPDANSLLSELLSDNEESVHVAIIDTGVRASHEALHHAFLGDFGWLDPIENSPVPVDASGHGTHVAGTIAGAYGIGVFPSAKFSSCRGCSASCPSSALIACGQFALCPTNSEGVEDCSKAAHVVSNSWNGGQGQNWFDGVIDAWHAGGVIPVFSAGNQGPACGSFQSPADSRSGVISVGASTNIDSVAYFSGAGPSVWGEVKPDISAPGYEVLSAWITGDNAYAAASGTSMACPHVTGLVALLKAYKRDLGYEEVKDLLASNAERDLVASGRVCGGVNGTVWPNNDYGHGRIDALAALNALIAKYPPPEPTTPEPEPETTTSEPEPITEEPPTEPPVSGPCPHGPVWFPDEVGVPSLVCICQASGCGAEAQYNCIHTATP